MNIELIIIGDEILNGRTIDANLAWLAPWLFRRGLKLTYASVVRDDHKAMLAALETAWARSQIVLTSGGIGPTLDDLTKSILAEFAGKQLVENQQARVVVEQNYTRLSRAWTPNTNGYHIIPQGFLATDNPSGFAPGLVWFEQGKALMAAPGVPREFQAMVDQVFFPLLSQHGFAVAGDTAQVIMRTHGMPEEKIFGELCPELWGNLEQYGKVSSLPHLTGVDILVTFEEQKRQHEIENEIRDLVQTTALSPYIWQWGALSLEEYILQKARANGVTLAFAESCTGGLVSSRLTDIAGSSDVILGSAVTYSNFAKEKFLGVKKSTLENFGAVSEEVAKEMALGALENFGADYAVSFSGIAGPGGGSELKPVGLVCQGLASKKQVQTRSLQFKGDRLKLKERFAFSGMFWLLEQLN